MREKVKNWTTEPSGLTRRRVLAAGMLAVTKCKLAADETLSDDSERDARVRKPSGGRLEVIALGMVASFDVLKHDEQRQSRRRLSVNFEIAGQLGLPEGTKSIVLRFNGLSRVFGDDKNEGFVGRSFLLRLLDDFSDPYDGRFEVWELKGSHP